MSDLRESFPSLENSSTGAGEALTSAAQGASPAGYKGSMALAFKDSSGNLVLPQLDSEGRLPVTQDAAGTPLKDRVENAAGSNTFVDLATLTLTADKNHVSISGVVSSFRDSHFQLVQVDDVTETILADFLVGPGQFTVPFDMGKLEVLAGSSGTQALKIKGKNMQQLSSLRAALSAIQVP